MTAKERLIVALDVPGVDVARELVSRIGDSVGMYKIGSQLFTAGGPAFVRELVAQGRPVFLDLKYHDIPNTVAGAVRAAVALEVSFVDVHASTGRDGLAAAAEACASSRTRLLAISVLTSHTPATLAEIGVTDGLDAAVRRLALLAQQAGAHGVVASPHEVELIREACGEAFLIVTPGIRPSGTGHADQARAQTPAEALRAGADYLVVGRPITQAADPAAAARAIVAELQTASIATQAT